MQLFSVLTLNNYPSEASIMVARQLKIVSQNDAFTICRQEYTVCLKKACVLDSFCKGHIWHLFEISFIILSFNFT